MDTDGQTCAIPPAMLNALHDDDWNEIKRPNATMMIFALIRQYRSLDGAQPSYLRRPPDADFK
jgi:hypothetical protein